MPALLDSVHELWGTVAQARIRRSVFSCRPGCHSCRWSSHSLLSWRMLWYRFYVFVLIYLIVFITDCFIWKWRTKRILVPSTFVGSFCLLVGLLIDCLVGCLVICFLWLVGRSVLVGWLVLVHLGAGWLLAWPHHDHFTHWFHRTQVQRWPQKLAAWVQVDITNLKRCSLFRGTGLWPMHLHIRYFATSQKSAMFPFLNWQIVDILRYLGVPAR